MRRARPDPRELATSRVFFCVICSERWPERQMHFQDGIEEDRRCPNDFEPNGGTIARDRDRADAAAVAASITARFASPARFPFWLDDLAAGGGVIAISPDPLQLVAGGASAELTLNGNSLASGDTIEYEHAGLTDAVAPSLTPVTYDSEGSPESPYFDVLVLTVQASAGVPAGYYSLSYNGNTFRKVFDVRAA